MSENNIINPVIKKLVDEDIGDIMNLDAHRKDDSTESRAKREFSISDREDR